MLEYFPVALVGCVEGFFREIVKELVDYGLPFSEQAKKLSIPFDNQQAISVILDLKIKNFTTGSLIAELVRINRFSDICQIMKVLLGDNKDDYKFIEDLKEISFQLTQGILF